MKEGVASFVASLWDGGYFCPPRFFVCDWTGLSLGGETDRHAAAVTLNRLIADAYLKGEVSVRAHEIHGHLPVLLLLVLTPVARRSRLDNIRHGRSVPLGEK